MSRRARIWHVAREAKHALAFAGPEDADDEGGIDATNSSGPAGTYGCACVSREAAECHRRRYGIVAGDVSHGAEECYCLCHQWSDDE